MSELLIASLLLTIFILLGLRVDAGGSLNWKNVGNMRSLVSLKGMLAGSRADNGGESSRNENAGRLNTGNGGIGSSTWNGRTSRNKRPGSAGFMGVRIDEHAAAAGTEATEPAEAERGIDVTGPLNLERVTNPTNPWSAATPPPPPISVSPVSPVSPLSTTFTRPASVRFTPDTKRKSYTPGDMSLSGASDISSLSHFMRTPSSMQSVISVFCVVSAVHEYREGEYREPDSSFRSLPISLSPSMGGRQHNNRERGSVFGIVEEGLRGPTRPERAVVAGTV
ncbi:hypothetical protein FPQ18DRAFT_303810 [Pyronema domesticum]|nr:hypothetical protein FPQ18DRAFT_303810 [Pyronema domesticum]